MFQSFCETGGYGHSRVERKVHWYRSEHFHQASTQGDPGGNNKMSREELQGISEWVWYFL